MKPLSQWRVIDWVRLAYITLGIFVTIWYRGFWTPDALFIFLLILFWLYGHGKSFFLAFSPFIVLLLVFDSMRSIVPLIAGRTNFWLMINFDRWAGHGSLPTARLQHLLYHGHLHWFDYGFYMLYMAHFLLPVLFAVMLWGRNIREYFRYVAALSTLSYAGVITYIAFPAAPPWMASQNHLISPIHRISSDVWWSMGVHNFPSIYQQLAPNEVAAVPSLHAAYPTLLALFVYRVFGWRWGLVATIYPVLIWLGVIYMGEHYLFDVILGVGYAVVAYVVTNALFSRYRLDLRLTNLLRRWLHNQDMPPVGSKKTAEQPAG
jgi:hypothetical protein